MTAKAVQEFGKTDWESMAKAGVALLGLTAIAMLIAQIKSQIIQGAVAILILGAALYVTALALEKFNNIDWGSLAKAGVALIGLAIIAALIGSFIAPIMLGAVALLVLSAALVVFATGMWIFSKAAQNFVPLVSEVFKGIPTIVNTVGKLIVDVINSIGNNIVKVIDSISGLGKLDGGNLIKVGAGITALGLAIGSFSAMVGGGSVMQGIGEGIGSLFGSKSPIENIMELTQKNDPNKILALASGIKSLADALAYFATQTANLNSIDTDKLSSVIDSINDASGNTVGGAVGGAITSVANSVGGAIASVFGGGESQQSQSPIQGQKQQGGDKLDQVISILSQISSAMTNQPAIIKIGDKTVEEIKTSLGMKKAFSIGVDNTYGAALSNK